MTNTEWVIGVVSGILLLLALTISIWEPYFK
jgi:hypothetical protein